MPKQYDTFSSKVLEAVIGQLGVTGKVMDKMPLLYALTVSMLYANFIATVSAHSIYRKYDTDGWSQPVISVLMQEVAHHNSSWETDDKKQGSENKTLMADSRTITVELTNVFAVQAAPAVSSSTLAGQSGSLASNGSQMGQSGSYVSGNLSDDQPESAYRNNSSSQFSFEEVTRDYFDDALFIGDSRVTGIQLYSGWDNITYYAEGGMTIYSMFDCKAAREEGRTLTIEEALQEHSFGKIYLEIGINEMGTGTVDSFMEAYGDAVDHLRELQPEVVIYVCGIMYVKQDKSESDPIFNNPNIQARNDRISQLADGEHIFYLDINEVMADETGNLNPDYTWDEVHLLGKYNTLWLEYFCKHGIVKDN